MYVRVKLIGLLKAAQIDSVEKCRAYEECESYPNNNTGILCRVPFAVDYLISHGVTVQDVTDMNVRSKDWSDGFKRGYEDGCKVGFNADKWISVRDRFPEEDGRYLVHIPDSWAYKVQILNFAKKLKKTGMYEFRHLRRRGWWDCDNEYGAREWNEVTHWMPLPEEPKGEI